MKSVFFGPNLERHAVAAEAALQGGGGRPDAHPPHSIPLTARGSPKSTRNLVLCPLGRGPGRHLPPLLGATGAAGAAPPPRRRPHRRTAGRGDGGDGCVSPAGCGGGGGGAAAAVADRSAVGIQLVKRAVQLEEGGSFREARDLYIEAADRLGNWCGGRAAAAAAAAAALTGRSAGVVPRGGRRRGRTPRRWRKRPRTTWSGRRI